MWVPKATIANSVPTIIVLSSTTFKSEAGTVTTMLTPLRALLTPTDDPESVTEDEEMIDVNTMPIRVDINMVYYLPTEFRARGDNIEIA